MNPEPAPGQTIVSQLKPGSIVRGPLFPEPVRVIRLDPIGPSVRLFGTGLESSRSYQPILSQAQLATLQVSPDVHPFDGRPEHFALGVEALRLGLAYEYDPYFALSIARIDPLPHQLEAVYDYFIKAPRIRFLLADDPGAGKTIMAGLLIQELKARGLLKRILIVTPANLTFQWQRELRDKFNQQFEILNSHILRAQYGTNPWMERDQVITSISWVSYIDDARASLLRSRWDLIIVDEAHKMSAASPDNKTLAYQLGEALGQLTDHYLLMTATPHKGDPAHFALFLRLLDQDVYGDVKSLEEAMRRNEAPFYLRRVKEALVTFPEPETGAVKRLFTRRDVRTIDFQIDADEWDFYDALTRYVEDQSIKGAADDSARGRAIGFTMAMLQRRFASSVYAARRTLERMKARREKILDNPDRYYEEQIQRRVPDDFDDLTEEEKDEILRALEEVVVSVDPEALREEIVQLGRLIAQAHRLEEREVESKLLKLRETITAQGVFVDPTMKLLIFTEHKDTLDYLAGDGRDGRPLGKLREWGLSVTTIHGGMKPGDRDTPGSRIHAEREFRDTCQVMVATEAAGEGINLQFCWFMINYDIPWNPVRLEQRMGRIHRYGQDKDCLIVNFVSSNTREGRVLQKLFDRVRQIERDLDPHGMGTVFNVLGDIFPSNQLERMVRDMYAHNQTEERITSRIVEEIDPERFRRITNSALEGLAKRQLNLASVLSKSSTAKEQRLVPEVVERFFKQAAPLAGIVPRPTRAERVFRVGRIPNSLNRHAPTLEPRFGRLAREYDRITFDQQALRADATVEWVTPGHPLFEVVREEMWQQSQPDLERGAVFYDLNRDEPAWFDLFTAAVVDGRGVELHQRLFVVETTIDGTMHVRQPAIFLDLIPAPGEAQQPYGYDLPGHEAAEAFLIEQELQGFLEQVTAERQKEVETIARHVEISLNVLIDRQNLRLAELLVRQQAGEDDSLLAAPLLAANIKRESDRQDELEARLAARRAELNQERYCTLADIRHYGRASILPHPEREQPEMAGLVRDEAIERIAVEVATHHETERGWQVVSVETDNKGFDLISRDPANPTEVRYIEVKGRAGVGPVFLSNNEYATAGRLREDYWLYVVYNCATTPQLHVIRDPSRLPWQPRREVVQYQADPRDILGDEAAQGNAA